MAGLIHYQQNMDCLNTAKYLITYNNEDPGTQNTFNALFELVGASKILISSRLAHLALFVRWIKSNGSSRRLMPARGVVPGCRRGVSRTLADSRVQHTVHSSAFYSDWGCWECFCP